MPVRIVITDGTTADCTQAPKLIDSITAHYLLADKSLSLSLSLSIFFIIIQVQQAKEEDHQGSSVEGINQEASSSRVKEAHHHYLGLVTGLVVLLGSL